MRTVAYWRTRAAEGRLALTRSELAEWPTAKVNIDYHIAVEKHLYSVPYPLIGERVTVEAELPKDFRVALNQLRRIAPR